MTDTHSDNTKTRANITLDAATLTEARDLRLNVSAISEAALVQAVRDARRDQWLAENAAAVAERKAWIEENGTPLASVQVLKAE